MTRCVDPILPVLLLLLFIGGCASHDSPLHQTPAPGTKTIIGGAGGAAVGGLLASALSGKNPALIAAGALGGGLLGGGLGSLLDTKDRASLMQATQAAGTAKAGTASPWKNPGTEHEGDLFWGGWQFSPRGTCRRYELRTTIEGERVVITGCAVQRSDGTWELQHGQ